MDDLGSSLRREVTTSDSNAHKQEAPKETIDSDKFYKTDLKSSYMEMHRPTPVKKLQFKVTLPQAAAVAFTTKARQSGAFRGSLLKKPAQEKKPSLALSQTSRDNGLIGFKLLGVPGKVKKP